MCPFGGGGVNLFISLMRTQGVMSVVYVAATSMFTLCRSRKCDSGAMSPTGMPGIKLYRWQPSFKLNCTVTYNVIESVLVMYA